LELIGIEILTPVGPGFTIHIIAQEIMTNLSTKDICRLYIIRA
jgi:hypothetical protein